MGSWNRLCLFSVSFFVPWLPQSKYLFPHHILSPGGKLPCHRQKKLGQVIASRSLTNHEPRSAISFLRPAILPPRQNITCQKVLLVTLRASLGPGPHPSRKCGDFHVASHFQLVTCSSRERQFYLSSLEFSLLLI